MSFDGLFACKITAELNEAVNCHIDKIYQPSRDELVFLLRKKGFVKKLLICAKSGVARLCFTEEKYENPAVPPMFCMLTRKYFSSARLIEVKQRGLERIIELCFETSNEMGDRINPKIVCELIGNKTNIILVGEGGRIIDAVRRSDIEDGERLVQPGALYEYPASQGKFSILDTDIDILTQKIFEYKELPLSRASLNVLDGFSPLLCREIAYMSDGDDVITADSDSERVKSALQYFKNELLCEKNAVLLVKEDGEPADFTFFAPKQFGKLYNSEYFESYSALLDAFYVKREAAARIRAAASDILRLVNNLHSRAQKRRAARLSELKNCENREELRIYGELLKANLHNIKQGASFAEVQNYYDENLDTIRIPLNPAISPSANAAKYFKDYKKTYTAEQTLLELTKKDEEELLYLDSVLDSLTRCENISDLREIKNELTEEGYLKAPKGSFNNKKKPDASGFKEYESVEGYRILVGKNNKQNDYLTTRLADKNDLWFHTKNIAGSHVLVLCQGREVSDETLIFAAELAAANSKAAHSSNVAVDYTPVKYVKKPNGAKAGMVIYTTNKTVFVTPKREE